MYETKRFLERRKRVFHEESVVVSLALRWVLWRDWDKFGARAGRVLGPVFVGKEKNFMAPLGKLGCELKKGLGVPSSA